MSKILSRLSLLSLLAACTAHDTPGGGSSSEGTGGGTLGQGETSVSDSDPTMPPTTTPPTTSGSVTVATTIDPVTTTFPDTDTFPETVTISDTSPTTATSIGSDTDGDTEFTTSLPECSEPPGQPQDSSCTDPSGCGCASGRCFLIPILGGFCGECLDDSDCAPGGCTTPNPVQGTGSRCNKGEPGAGCQTDAVCVDPGHADCAPILDVMGIFTASTCGACTVNADCPQDQPNCSPVYDIKAFAGQFECVASGSVANNGGCNLDSVGGVPVGDAACQSGHCGEANVMGILKLGICGECNIDADCGPGEQCEDAVVDLDKSELIGASCQ
jgi:hypothetical protein